MAKKKNNELSIKDIARLSGVSVATVSRVINNNGRFSEETRERVLDIIKKANYSPNAIARGLRTNRTKIIAVIVPDITNEFFSTIVQTIQLRAFEEGYTCTTFHTNESKELEEQFLESIKAMNVSGIISINGHFDLSAVISENVPIIYIDRNPDDIAKQDNCVFVSSDHESGGYLAGKALAERGAKNVACITALKDAVATSIRTNGFMRACKEFGLRLSKKHIYHPDVVSADDAYRIVSKSLVKEKGAYDAVFCETDWLAVGTLSALLDNGIRVPEEIQVVGFDNIRVTTVVSQPISTIDQPKRDIANVAMDNLFDLIEGKEIEEKIIVLPVEFIQRNTTRDIL